MIISSRKTIVHVGRTKAKFASKSVAAENTLGAAAISRRTIRLYTREEKNNNEFRRISANNELTE